MPKSLAPGRSDLYFKVSTYFAPPPLEDTALELAPFAAREIRENGSSSSSLLPSPSPPRWLDRRFLPRPASSPSPPPPPPRGNASSSPRPPLAAPPRGKAEASTSSSSSSTSAFALSLVRLPIARVDVCGGGGAPRALGRSVATRSATHPSRLPQRRARANTKRRIDHDGRELSRVNSRAITVGARGRRRRGRRGRPRRVPRWAPGGSAGGPKRASRPAPPAAARRHGCAA